MQDFCQYAQYAKASIGSLALLVQPILWERVSVLTAGLQAYLAVVYTHRRTLLGGFFTS